MNEMNVAEFSQMQVENKVNPLLIAAWVLDVSEQLDKPANLYEVERPSKPLDEWIRLWNGFLKRSMFEHVVAAAKMAA